MARAIESLGLETFLDVNDVEAGDRISEEVRRAIRNCFELVVLLTRASLDSRYVWLEMGAAWVLGKRLVAVLDQITPDEFVTAKAIPAILKDVSLLDLNEFDRYLKELHKRARRSHGKQRTRG